MWNMKEMRVTVSRYVREKKETGNIAQPIGGEGKEKAEKTRSNKSFQFLSVF